MELEQFLERNMLVFLDSKIDKKSRRSSDMEEEYGLYLIRDYVNELTRALDRDELSKAKKIFDDLKDYYNRLPEDSFERKKIYSLLEQMYSKIEEYVHLRDAFGGPKMLFVGDDPKSMVLGYSTSDKQAVSSLNPQFEKIINADSGRINTEQSDNGFSTNSFSDKGFNLNNRTQERLEQEMLLNAQLQNRILSKMQSGKEIPSLGMDDDAAQKEKTLDDDLDIDNIFSKAKKTDVTENDFQINDINKDIFNLKNTEKTGRDMRLNEYSRFSRQKESGHLVKKTHERDLSWQSKQNQQKKDMESDIASKRAAFDSEFASKRAALNSELTSKRLALDSELASKRAAFDSEFASKRAALNSELTSKRLALDSELASKRAAIDSEISKEHTREPNSKFLDKDFDDSNMINTNDVSVLGEETIYQKTNLMSRKNRVSTDAENYDERGKYIDIDSELRTSKERMETVHKRRNWSSSNSSFIEELYSQGIYMIFHNNYVEASRIFEKIIELKPSHKAARIRLQQCSEAI